MTCPCSAQFCYACGIRWKYCNCQTADPNRIEEHAEKVVERDVGPNLLPAEWRRRVNEVFADLQRNYECEHSGRFRRMTGSAPRRGYRCEMGDRTHYKYILQCPHRYINACEDCRRIRI
ncbi:hypothetical protein EJ02DRAFT_509678 [Clathrospora elynae]|uniref:IBR domain-containing protein n=1 Tax=Clathrospora elynae TaxID=706981 RepID=A0A6A5SZV8_9PLEO|nr:hypothetical protein EJ02DRAFT_509678 [Clathrospora elynae]